MRFGRQPISPTCRRSSSARGRTRRWRRGGNVLVDPRDFGRTLREFRSDVALAAADIEHARTLLHGLDRGGMRGREAELEIVGQFHLPHVEFPIVEQIHLVALRPEHRFADVPRVLEPVHVTDFVAVKSGNRNLGDAQPGEVQLHDDVGIEVKIV